MQGPVPDETVRAQTRACPTCNGRDPGGVIHRETTGLVCQTCGWDYYRWGEP